MSFYDIYTLATAQKNSMYNMEKIKKVEHVGCYFCKKMYQSIEIEKTTDNGKTAVCPYCNIDAVIPESKDYYLKQSLLNAMNSYFLQPPKEDD